MKHETIAPGILGLEFGVAIFQVCFGKLAIVNIDLGGGFKYFLFSPQFGEDSHFDEYFSDGLVQPPTSD